MKRVFRSESLAEVGHLRNVLEQAGIACMIRNDKLSGGLGEIPFLECLPELWVIEDGKAEAAKALITEHSQPADSGEAWRCSHCGEPNESQFALCWQCGHAHPED
jgi:hypothetical protein